MKEEFNWNLDGLLIDGTFDKTYKTWNKLEQDYYDSIALLAKDKDHFKKWIELRIMSYRYYDNLTAYIDENLKESPKATKWKSLKIKFWNKVASIWKKKQNEFAIVILNQKTISNFLSDPSLSMYLRYIDNQFFNSSDKSIVNKEFKTVVRQNDPIRLILDKLNDDMFNLIERPNDEYGNPVENMSINDCLTSDDRELRYNMWINHNIAIKKMKRTFAELFYWYAFRSNEYGRANNFTNYIDQTISNYEIKYTDYLKIIRSSLSFKDLYLKFRQKNQDLFIKINEYDSFKPWDVDYLNLKKSVEYISIPDAITHIALSLKPLGNEYISLLKNKVIKEKWVDWIHDKREYKGNNYSLSLYKICPISIDYNYTNYGVVTASHEIGHSICSYLSQQAQTIYITPNQLTGEIASYVNETLTRFYLLDLYKNNVYSQYSLLKNMLTRFFDSVTLYSLFEKFKTHINNKFKQNEQSLSNYKFEMEYFKIRHEYIGTTSHEKLWKKFRFYELVPLEIYSDLSNYFNDFNRLKYILGQIFGLVIAWEIYHGNNNLRQRYLKFLSTGWSKPPLESLSELGISFKNDSVYKKAMSIITKFLDKFLSITIDQNGNFTYNKIKEK